MKRTVFLTALVMAITSCDSTTGPGAGPNPAGRVVAWFNGLSGTVDLYFPGCDSLVSSAYLTGSSPNDMLYAGSDLLLVVNSLSQSLQVFDLSATGPETHRVDFPAGSNPWAMASGYGRIWVTLTQTHQLAAVSTDDWALEGISPVDHNPAGVAVAAGCIFVSHGFWPEPSSPGGVSVLDAGTLEVVGWLDTGVNTTELWLCEETGLIHAFSTTYADDGAVSLIDPVSASVLAQVATGGAPGSPVRIGSRFACCDGFGDRIFVYEESGTLVSEWVPVGSISIGGLSVSGDTLYVTSFGEDMVYRALWETQSLLEGLAAGDGPQGMLSVDRD